MQSLTRTNLPISLALAMLATTSAHAQAWDRGPRQADFALKQPWKTNGLTPVELTGKPGLAPIVLADKGRATLPIVIPAGVPYYAEVAATLKEFLDEATGASFDIVDDRQRPTRGIFVGPCQHPEVEQAALVAGELPPENFLVDCFEGGVILLGRDLNSVFEETGGRLGLGNVRQSRGTYFAALDFLERFVGVRFFMPGRLGTVVPYLNDRTLIFPAVTYQDGPVFKSRQSSYGAYLTKDHQLLGYTKKAGLKWMSRLRCADVYRLKWGHTDTYWHEVYASSHPEYFALREDGGRMVGDGNVHSSQRCYSNEAGFQEHLNIIDRYYQTGKGERLLRSPPNSKYIYWWPNDGFRGCACSQCMKLTDPAAPQDRVHSRLIWSYVAKLARAVQERWPGKVLCVPLYATWYHVPSDFNMPDNIRLIVTWNHLSEALFKEPKYWDYATGGLKQQNRWSCEPVTIWSHYPHKPRIKNGLDTPYPLPHVLKRLLVSHRDQISGVYLNGYACTSFALDGYILYVYKKLLWNPNLDVDACLDDYCRALFGPAAGEVKNYLARVIDRWETTRWSELPEGFDFVDGRIEASNFFIETYPREVRIQLKNSLARAVAAAEPGTVYHARASYFAEATEPFFVQGEVFDRGQMEIAEAARRVPTIDGKLDDWEGVPPITLGSDADGGKANVQTQIFFAYGPEAFYVAGQAAEPATLSTFDPGMPLDSHLWKRDSIELFLCTPQPGIKEAGLSITEQFHQIVIDPNGSVTDGYKGVTDGKIDFGKDLDLTVETQRHPRGYTFEMAIPYASLGTAAPEPGDHWIVNLYRNRPRDGVPREKWVSSWSPSMGSHDRTARFGRLEFPTETYWNAKLQGDFNASWSIMSNVSGKQAHFKPGQYITITPSTVDGRLHLRVRADETLPKITELKFVARKPDATFPEPVLLDWKFRFKGKGLKRARHYAVDKHSKSRLQSNFKVARGSSGSGGVNQRSAAPGTGEMESLFYYAFALTIEPGADFVFEIDRVRITARP